MNTFLTILTGIAIASVSSLITVQLSLSQFRDQKWWEKKHEAYSHLLGAIHDAKAFAEENMNAYEEDNDISPAKNKEIRAKSNRAEAEIYRLMDMGAFYLSQEVITRLKQYKTEESEASNTKDWYHYLSADFAATDLCLKDMINLAKEDLKIENTPLKKILSLFGK